MSLITSLYKLFSSPKHIIQIRTHKLLHILPKQPTISLSDQHIQSQCLQASSRSASVADPSAPSNEEAVDLSVPSNVEAVDPFAQSNVAVEDPSAQSSAPRYLTPASLRYF